MSCSRTIVCALLAGLCAAVSVQAQCPFRVVAHPEDAALSKGAEPLLAEVWALAQELLGAPPGCRASWKDVLLR